MESIISASDIISIINIGISIGIIALLREKESFFKSQIDSLKNIHTASEEFSNKQIVELKESKAHLERVLATSNVNSYSYIENNSEHKIDKSTSIQIKKLFNDYENLKKSILQPQINDIELHLSMAKAFSADEEWLKAAQQFEIVTKIKDNDWELFLSKGIAYANSRNNEYYLKSIESYSLAITYITESKNTNTKARLYIYRGSILKRINRLDEAKSDLELGLSLANEDHEISDGLYNLACIHAMKGNRTELYKTITKLEELEFDSTITRLKNRLQKYAPQFADDI